MRSCPRCAVDVSDTTVTCPLCGETTGPDAVQPDQIVPAYPRGPEVPLKIPRDNPELRQRIFALVTICLGLPLITVLLIDRLDGNLSWSLFAITPLVCAWFYSGLLLYWTSRPRRHSAAILLVTAVLLAGLDRNSGSWDWFPSLGLPILGTLALLQIPFFLLYFHKRLGWFNAIGWGLIALALWCLVIDVAIQHYRGLGFTWTWSLIVLASLFPAGLFMLYIHHRVRKHVDLKKWFHI